MVVGHLASVLQRDARGPTLAGMDVSGPHEPPRDPRPGRLPEPGRIPEPDPDPLPRPDPPAPRRPPERRNRDELLAEGGWYYPVVVLSLGMLAPIPFAHVAARLRTRASRLWVVLYTAALIALLVGADAEPDGSNVAGGLIIGYGLVAMVHLTALRARVWPPTPLPLPAGPDPAVAAALAARARRAEARRIVDHDPLLARDLRIGRPDLARDYDDGGLVDLNAVPAAEIARCCGIDEEPARRIVEAREAAGVPFGRVEDAFTWTDVPVGLWDRIRDRAIVLPG